MISEVIRSLLLLSEHTCCAHEHLRLSSSDVLVACAARNGEVQGVPHFLREGITALRLPGQLPRARIERVASSLMCSGTWTHRANGR